MYNYKIVMCGGGGIQPFAFQHVMCTFITQNCERIIKASQGEFSKDGFMLLSGCFTLLSVSLTD